MSQSRNRNYDYLGRVDIIAYIGTNHDTNKVVKAIGIGICKDDTKKKMRFK